MYSPFGPMTSTSIDLTLGSTTLNVSPESATRRPPVILATACSRCAPTSAELLPAAEPDGESGFGAAGGSDSGVEGGPSFGPVPRKRFLALQAPWVTPAVAQPIAACVRASLPSRW